MAETLYNVTITNTSPTINYTPYVINDTSTGWQSTCPTYVTSASGQNSWMCDPDSAHTTSSYGAGLQFTFDGVGIYLFGNTTNNLGYDITLDDSHFPGNPRPDSDLLYHATGLQPGQHTISLTVRQPASTSDPGSVTFKEAVVSAGTGLTGAEVTTKIVDDADPSITYYAPPGGNWTVEDTYTQSIGPSGSTTFHDSYWTDATATIQFQGIGVAVYGACYSHSRYAAYAASIDGGEETSYDGTVNLYSADGIVKQRAGNCLRYFKTGLDGARDHTLVLRVKDAGRLAVDWVEVISASGGAKADGGNPSPGTRGMDPPPEHTDPKIRIIAGAIAGGVVLALALLMILICFRRRKHDGPQDILTPPPTQVMMAETGLQTTPFQPPFPPTTPPAHGMPPWPQPQSPAPSHTTSHNSAFMNGGMTAGRVSVSSSAAPLISPGLSSLSAHSGSGSGPGWVETTTYRSNSYSSTPGAGPSGSSRPGEFGSTTAVSGSSWAPGSSNVAVEGGPSAGSIASGGGGYFGNVRIGSVPSPAPSAPPAYDQIQGVYAGVGTARRK